MLSSRRDVLKAGAAAVAGALLLGADGAHPPTSILDSHIHLWDLKQFHLPWLDRAEPLLKRDYSVADYQEAIRGTGITGAVYIEVEVEPAQWAAEAQYANRLCSQPRTLIPAAVIGGNPADPGFATYISGFKDADAIKGVRFPYPDGASASNAFMKGIRALGDAGMSFDLLLGSPQMQDAAKLVEACPDTTFILDHCGGGGASLFRKNTDHIPAVQRDQWKHGVEQLAKRSKVFCKISGVADGALPGDATAQDCAPVVNFCLEQFGPDRVLFGTNWPVCLKGTTIKHWLDALNQVVATRPVPEKQRLFHDNCARAYRIREPVP